MTKAELVMEKVAKMSDLVKKYPVTSSMATLGTMGVATGATGALISGGDPLIGAAHGGILGGGLGAYVGYKSGTKALKSKEIISKLNSATTPEELKTILKELIKK